MSYRRERIAAILADHGAECFDTLVAEYAAMGYSEYATARRLLGIDVRTMRSWLSKPVQFQRHGRRWADPEHNAAQVLEARKRNGTLRFIEHDGARMHLNEWERRTGIKARTIARRIDTYGWPVERALTVTASCRGGKRHNQARTRLSTFADLKTCVDARAILDDNDSVFRQEKNNEKVD